MAARIRNVKQIDNGDFLIWKENPPGAAQKELENMFLNKMIDENDTPASVRTKNPIFLKFSTRIFALHFRKTKAKLGLMGKICILLFFIEVNINIFDYFS